jgi:hypothetical protein
MTGGSSRTPILEQAATPILEKRGEQGLGPAGPRWMRDNHFAAFVPK